MKERTERKKKKNGNTNINKYKKIINFTLTHKRNENNNYFHP